MHEGRDQGNAGFLTVTHARVRASQGDILGAREVLRALLRRRPDDAPAREMLARIEGETHRPERLEAAGGEAPPTTARPADLKARFARELDAAGRAGPRRRALRRLRSWLERARRAAGEKDA